VRAGRVERAFAGTAGAAVATWSVAAWSVATWSGKFLIVDFGLMIDN